jgi:phenylalanyl-tRNA synthetase beta chain
LGSETIKKILASLEIKIEGENEKGLSLRVPPYRVDVKREADVIEEILRIYGYNNVEIPSLVKSSLQYAEKPDNHQLRNLVSEMLTAQGFNEIWSNSLTKAGYYESFQQFSDEKTVKLLNPLSADLNGMRQTLLWGGLEAIAYNTNRQNKNLKLYEFGNCYSYKGTQLKEHPETNYHKRNTLALLVTGNRENENWANKEQPASFFTLKTYAENVLKRLGFSIGQMQFQKLNTNCWAKG